MTTVGYGIIAVPNGIVTLELSRSVPFKTPAPRPALPAARRAFPSQPDSAPGAATTSPTLHKNCHLDDPNSTNENCTRFIPDYIVLNSLYSKDWRERRGV